MSEKKSINIEKLKECMKDESLAQLVYGAMQVYLTNRLTDIPEGALTFLLDLGILNPNG